MCIGDQGMWIRLLQDGIEGMQENRDAEKWSRKRIGETKAFIKVPDEKLFNSVKMTKYEMTNNYKTNILVSILPINFSKF